MSSKLQSGIPAFGVKKDKKCKSGYCLNTNDKMCWDSRWKYNTSGGCELPSVTCPIFSNEDIALEEWDLRKDGYYNIIGSNKINNIPYELIGSKPSNNINKVSRNTYSKPLGPICNNCCKNIKFSKDTKCSTVNCENTTNNMYCSNYCLSKTNKDSIVCPKSINEIINMGGIIDILKKL